MTSVMIDILPDHTDQAIPAFRNGGHSAQCLATCIECVSCFLGQALLDWVYDLTVGGSLPPAALHHWCSSHAGSQK